ncbi:hypothetical protein KC8_10020 [Sphingomonas sp. KC8]|nr:hypothetical protein KC8_10020 [Sphingomonas sp. KC8]
MPGGNPDQRRARLEEVRRIAADLNDRARSLAMNLLPNGHEENGGRYWRVKNFAGDAGQALCIDIAGDNIGQWTNFASCKGASDWSGDMLDLVARVRFRGRKKDAIDWARSILGHDNLDPARLAVEQARRAERQRSAEQAAKAKAEQMLRSARGLFLNRAGARPIIDTPAEWYLAARGIDLSLLEVDGTRYVPRGLAFHPAVTCKEAGEGVRLPALIARVLDGKGQHVATHRTWLAQDAAGTWGKAPVPNPKMTLARYQDADGGGYIPIWKGVCRRTLADITPGTDVYASEGIEDALSVAVVRPDRRVIAAVSISNIGNLVLPPQAGRLVIIGQNDGDDSPAAKTLATAIARQHARGREVAIIRPPADFKDFNDWLCGKRMRKEAA